MPTLSGTDDEICARIAEIMAELEALGALDEGVGSAANDNSGCPSAPGCQLRSGCQERAGRYAVERVKRARSDEARPCGKHQDFGRAIMTATTRLRATSRQNILWRSTFPRASFTVPGALGRPR